jgi:hypothetical protein
MMPARLMRGTLADPALADVAWRTPGEVFEERLRQEIDEMTTGRRPAYKNFGRGGGDEREARRTMAHLLKT